MSIIGSCLLVGARGIMGQRSSRNDLEDTLAVRQKASQTTMSTTDQPSDDNWYTSRSLLSTQDKLYLVHSSILLSTSTPIS